MPIVSPDINPDQSQSGEDQLITDNPAVANVGGGFVIPIHKPEGTSESISLTSGGTELKQIQIPCGFVYHKIIFPKDTTKQVTHETTVLSDDSFMTTDKINVRAIDLADRTNLNISDGVRFYVHPELLLWLKTSKIKNNKLITYYIFIPIDTRKLAPISLEHVNDAGNDIIYPEINYSSEWEWTTDDPTLPEDYEGKFIELMMKHKTFKFYDISESRTVSLDKLRTIGACAHPNNIIVTYINENNQETLQQSIPENIRDDNNLSYELMGLCNLKDVVNDYTDNFNNYPVIIINTTDGYQSYSYTIDDYRSYIPNTGNYKNIIDIIVSTIIYYYKLIDSNKIVQHYVNDFNGYKKNIFTKFRNLDTSNCDNDYIWYNISTNTINDLANAEIIGGSLDSFYKRKIYLKVKK